MNKNLKGSGKFFQILDLIELRTTGNPGKGFRNPERWSIIYDEN